MEMQNQRYRLRRDAFVRGNGAGIVLIGSEQQPLLQFSIGTIP
jgi:hypothetical protein